MNILFLFLIFTVLLRPVESVHFRVCVGPMLGGGGSFLLMVHVSGYVYARNMRFGTVVLHDESF